MLRRKRKGQSTAEYAIVIGLVIAAAVAMQVYVKRGIMAKVKGASDYQPDAMFVTKQYEPYYASSDITRSSDSKLNTETREGGEVVRAIVGQETSTTSGQQNVSGVR